MGFRERFQNFDKFKAFMATLLLLTFVATTFNTYQIFMLSGGNIVTTQQNKKPSSYKFGVAYEKAAEAQKPMAVLFYADWCRFCIAFMPKYQKLYKQYKRKYNFVKINVEDPLYREQVEKYEIQGFPTLFLVNPKTDSNIRIDNMDFESKDKMKEHFDNFFESTKEVQESESTEEDKEVEETDKAEENK